MEKYNLKSIIAALIVLICGILMILLDLFYVKTTMNLWISIGCSLIASAMVILLNDLFVEKINVSPLDEWKISKIYATRAEKNADSDPELEKAKYQIDAVAFGLKSFRTEQSRKVEACLRKGVNFRIITMNPMSSFVAEREKEENETEDQIKNTINQLIIWANELNKKNYKGKIIVRGYSCMTLDFYWRVDDELYVGPYWYGVDSQQTITYKFTEGGKGFSRYTDYFEKLWENQKLIVPLTEITEFSFKQKGKRKKNSF